MKQIFVNCRFFCILVLFLTSGASASACSEYVHLWRPVNEVSSASLSPEGVALLIEKLLVRLPKTEKTWNICVNPVSDMPAATKKSLLSSVSLLDQNKFVWNDNLSPFDEKSGNIAAIWLDFVDPSHTTYWWKDENKPPVAMFRIGEMDTAVVRVMARNSAGKIVFIEELKHLFLLESDFMLPGWIGVASGWARRLSLQLGFDSKRVEYTFAEPPDQEEINQIPANVTRFYFGETVSNR